MELSNRLKFIAHNLDNCKSLIDVGSDHGYIPIYAVKNNICSTAIASDINIGPVEKAKTNVMFEGVANKVDVRLGGGLSTVKIKEVEAVVIAGMGGNLIKDILEDDINKVKMYKFLVLQPAQNPEILREYLYNNGYDILCEDLCKDDGIFYELFKVKKSNSPKIEMDSIFYEISPYLLKSKHPLMKEYLEHKEEKYNKILSLIKDNSESCNKRKAEIEEKLNFINKFKGDL